MQGLSSPRCGHCNQGLEQILVEPVVQLLLVVVEPRAQLVVVILGELEVALVGLVVLVSEEALGLDHSFGHVIETWSQWLK